MTLNKGGKKNTSMLWWPKFGQNSKIFVNDEKFVIADQVANNVKRMFNFYSSNTIALFVPIQMQEKHTLKSYFLPRIVANAASLCVKFYK